jgi:ribosomal peptide maturation radical SAM protein 1
MCAITVDATGRADHAITRLALVTMPWARTDIPSISCGLLKAELRQRGFQADVHYLNLELSALLGPEIYVDVMEIGLGRAQLLGEWLFAGAAFDSDDGAEYARLINLLPHASLTKAKLLELRNDLLPRWIESVAAESRWADYQLIGFSSTFQQNVASLALARLLKRRFPDVPIVFGGANFDGDMGPEYVRTMPWIDFAVVGEGDKVFPELVNRLAHGSDPAGIPGLCYRKADGSVSTSEPAPLVTDLDELPCPDYEEYFTQLSRLGQPAVLGKARPHLLYESSRGCWWGEKHHCTFCGLNGLGMKYRSKSPQKFVDDLRELAEKYHVLHIDAVDNILEMSYLKTVIPLLASQNWDLRLFYEVKANLTPEQLLVMRNSGIVAIQPGIESLSTHVLELMRKGSNLHINLRTLKWAQAYGIDVYWNILTGFPGETTVDYERQTDLIPALLHLRPPGFYGKFFLERFSPYFTDSSFPIECVRPSPEYGLVYPPNVRPDQVAYYFDYLVRELPPPAVYDGLGRAVTAWQERWSVRQPPVFNYERGPGWIRIVDTRHGHRREALLESWRGAAFEYCGIKARTPAGVAEFLTESTGAAPGGDRLQRFLDQCVAERLMVGDDDGHYFGLALPSNERLRFTS